MLFNSYKLKTTILSWWIETSLIMRHFLSLVILSSLKSILSNTGIVAFFFCHFAVNYTYLLNVCHLKAACAWILFVFNFWIILPVYEIRMFTLNIWYIRIYTYPWRRRRHPTPVLLPGKSHGQRSLVGCGPWGRKELDMTERLPFHFSLSGIGEGNSNPLQCSCLENPRDGGAWCAAVYGVTQSRTRLKRLSSSCILTIPLRLYSQMWEAMSNF